MPVSLKRTADKEMLVKDEQDVQNNFGDTPSTAVDRNHDDDDQQQQQDASSVESSAASENFLIQQQQLASLPPLGPGPLRFEPSSSTRRLTIEEQLDMMSEHDRGVVIRLKSRWEQEYPEVPFSDAMYIQFARYSRGPLSGGGSSTGSSIRSSSLSRRSSAAAEAHVAGGANTAVDDTNKSRNFLRFAVRSWGKNKTGTETVAGAIENGTCSNTKINRHHLFNERVAWDAMVRFDHRYLSLTAEILDTQLRSKTLFPVPGLAGKPPPKVSMPLTKSNGRQLPMFYMRPSRYFPRSTPIEEVIDNLAYIMLTMTVGDHDAQMNGIGLIANMNGWTFDNFSVQYCSAFMSMLQGHVLPVHVELFLIVDPPTWFPAIWKIMKPMMSSNFRRKVHIVSQCDLHKYFLPGFEQFLPDEMGCGEAKTTDIVRDFIAYRQHVEEIDSILAASDDIEGTLSAGGSSSGGLAHVPNIITMASA